MVDGAAFVRVDLAFRFLVEEGSDDGAAMAIDGAIADNIPLQLFWFIPNKTIGLTAERGASAGGRVVLLGVP